jgi:hypothetical protein
MTLEQMTRAFLDIQEQTGWHHDWPEALTAIRAVLDAHSPGEGEVVYGECEKPEHGGGYGCDCVRRYRCPVCVASWRDEETQTAPCATVRAIAEALEVEQWNSRP